MNVEQIVKKYSDAHSDKSYSRIADLILAGEDDIELSHRTLRQKISKYLNSKEEALLDEYIDSLEKTYSQFNKTDECCGNPMDCDNSCMNREAYVKEESIKYEENSWNKESTVDYFKNVSTTDDVFRQAYSQMVKDREKYIPTQYKQYPLTPQESYKVLQPYLNGNPDNVLVIGDTHEPFTREGYMEHCLEMQIKFDCGTVIHIGDEVDNHALSYHESNSEADSVAGEFEKAMVRMKEWYRVFPEVTVIVGNHSALPFRKANTAGLSKRFLKAYEDIWEAPKGWNWKVNHEFLGVYYTHNASSKPLNMAVNRRQSVVAGHHHTVASIEWNVSKKDKIFGMLTGCGIDDSSYAFSYAKDNAKKSIISCAVVLNGEIPIILPMDL